MHAVGSTQRAWPVLSSAARYQAATSAVGASIISLRGYIQCYMHAGIVHVQPSFRPIVWLSRRTEAAIAVLWDASLPIAMYSDLLYGSRVFKITGLGQAAAIGLASSRTPFTPQALISTNRPSSASLSWNGGAHSVTNTFFCVFVFQASRNVENLKWARVEQGPNVLFLSAFSPALSCVSAEAERPLSSNRDGTWMGPPFLFLF